MNPWIQDIECIVKDGKYDGDGGGEIYRARRKKQKRIHRKEESGEKRRKWEKLLKENYMVVKSTGNERKIMKNDVCF